MRLSTCIVAAHKAGRVIASSHTTAQRHIACRYVELVKSHWIKLDMDLNDFTTLVRRGEADYKAENHND